jgi:radical SAM-linked protein
MLSQPQKVRVQFSKTGSLKFISHLDLNRTVKSAFLRSKLPIWYTQGFNPHPKTVFSVPLSVGTASLCEFMDFRITDEVSGKVICDTLNSVFPEGLRAIEAYEPKTKFCEIGWADYEIRIEIADAASKTGAVEAALKEPIVIEKTTKIGSRTVDVSEFVKLISVTEENGELVLRVKLCCDTMNFVNPKYVIDFIAQKTGFPGEKDDYSVCRTAVYFPDGITPFL